MPSKSKNKHIALWRRLVKEYPQDAIATLEEAAAQNIWDEYLWSSPLYSWQKINGVIPPITASHGNKLLSLLLSMPENQRTKLAVDIAYWLGQATDFIESPEAYLELWDWCWPLALRKNSNEENIDSFSTALNHPTGHLAQGLLNKVFPQTITFDQGIPSLLQTRVQKILENDSKGNLGHIIVASRFFQLFFLDPIWFERTIVPLLSFENPKRFVQFWEGYLWDARITPNLAKLLKNSLLKAIEQISNFSNLAQKALVQLVTMISVDNDVFSGNESKSNLAQMDPKQLHEAVEFLIRRSESLESKAGDYWVSTLKPWLTRNWSRNKTKMTPELSEDFAVLALTTGEKFEDSVDWLKNAGLLCEAPDAGQILEDFKRGTETSEEEFHPTKFPEKFPAATFDLIDTLRPFSWDFEGATKTILDRIAKADPYLRKTLKFKNLYEAAP